MSELEQLREDWKELYAVTLPSLARARDPSQPKWPVTLDHCFARIILDNTVGEGKVQWDKRIKRPAYKNMTKSELEGAIHLGLRIKEGREDLVALDLQSLEARGKSETKYKAQKKALSSQKDRKRDSEAEIESDTAKPALKRKAGGMDKQSTELLPSKKTRRSPEQSMLKFAKTNGKTNGDHTDLSKPDLQPTISKIQTHGGLTPYRKRLYASLCSVPEGRYTTYAALSSFLDSSARAVGSGMRNNPFAPEVPCHRVLASDGTIGGFGGSWGADGKNANKKIELLMREGVGFDSSGRVKGLPFKHFVNLLNE